MKYIAPPYDIQFAGKKITVYTWRWNAQYERWTPRYYGSTYSDEMLMWEFQTDRDYMRAGAPMFFNVVRYYEDRANQ